MRFCDDHWTRLREAIEAEGVGDLVAQDGKRAAEMFAGSLGEETLATFDPLMWAHWAIIGRIGKHAPGVLFVEGCPICWVQDDHEQRCTTPGCTVTRQTFEDWIPGVAHAAAGRVRALREQESAT